MPVFSEADNFVADAIVDLFEIDFSTIEGMSGYTTKMRLTAYKDGTSDIAFGGNTFESVDLLSSGYGSSLSGQPPKPFINIATRNLFSNSAYTGALAHHSSQNLGNIFDWRGATVIRRKVFAKNLDGGSLPNSSNVFEERYLIDGYVSQDKFMLEFSLTVSLGADRSNLRSARNLSSGLCQLSYRVHNGSGFDYFPFAKGGCPYGQTSEASKFSHLSSFGTAFFNSSNVSTPDAAADYCTKTITGCQKRFDPSNAGKPLPFSGLFRSGTERTTNV